MRGGDWALAARELGGVESEGGEPAVWARGSGEGEGRSRGEERHLRWNVQKLPALCLFLGAPLLHSFFAFHILSFLFFMYSRCLRLLPFYF